MSEEFDEYEAQEPLDFGRGFFLALGIELLAIIVIALILWAVFAL